MNRMLVETVSVLLDDVSTLRLVSSSYRFLQDYVLFSFSENFCLD